MDPITQQTALASAGGKKDPLYVDDVFSTYLYDGNEGSNQINNGIDLAGKGGLVWFKNRTRSGDAPTLIDTETQSGGYLVSSGPAGLALPQPFSSFNSNGYTINSGLFYVNDSSHRYASWTFRKAPGFFDVVTYTGTGSARTVAHNLGSAPGMIIIKNLDDSNPWWAVYHHSLGDQILYLNETTAAGSAGSMWNNTTPTSSVFTVGTPTNVNADGDNYVAYIFAHDDAQFGTGGNESIVKCGSYTGTNTWGNFKVDLGFEPQFVLMKNASGSGDWIMLDSMRGITGPGDYPLSDTSTFFSALQAADDAQLEANSSSNESTQGRASLYSQGFLGSTGTSGGVEYIYMAIRRPHKPPELATEVFAMNYATESTGNRFTTGFPVDLTLSYLPNNGMIGCFQDRLRGYPVPSSTAGNYPILFSSSANSESVYNNSSPYLFGADSNTSIGIGSNLSGNISLIHAFKRAPGFMDVVTYSGTGVTRTVNHNLTVKPELMIFKIRSHSFNWITYDKVNGATNYMSLNSDNGTIVSSSIFNNTEPTSSVFTVAGASGNVNYSGGTHVAYLFATLPGVSKVGSYTGNGGTSSFNVDCGFTNGARFVLIKDTTSGNDWYLWDTLRGMTSSAAPYLRLNVTGQPSASDWVETQPTGFKVTTGTNANLRINVSGNAYLFLAIA
jgi:hypothetical protein